MGTEPTPRLDRGVAIRGKTWWYTLAGERYCSIMPSFSGFGSLNQRKKRQLRKDSAAWKAIRRKFNCNPEHPASSAEDGLALWRCVRLDEGAAIVSTERGHQNGA